MIDLAPRHVILSYEKKKGRQNEFQKTLGSLRKYYGENFIAKNTGSSGKSYGVTKDMFDNSRVRLERLINLYEFASRRGKGMPYSIVELIFAASRIRHRSSEGMNYNPVVVAEYVYQKTNLCR